MQKRIVCLLTLCMALAASMGAFGAEAPEALMAMSAPAIVYDGTILRVFLDFSPTTEEIALVEGSLLNPDLWREREVQEALATGAELMGVSSAVELRSADRELTDRVFSDVQNGRAMTKGFHYVLTPSSPRENMTVRVTATLHGTADGPALEYTETELPVPEAIEARTASLPADILLGAARIDEVFISSSPEAFCVLLHVDGETNFTLPGAEDMYRDAPYEATYTDAAGGEPHAEQFRLSVMQPEEDTPWWVFVFDPVEEMPEQMILSLDDAMMIEDTISLRIDVAEGSVTAL